jgi:hypothetical protein
MGTRTGFVVEHLQNTELDFSVTMGGGMELVLSCI